MTKRNTGTRAMSGSRGRLKEAVDDFYPTPPSMTEPEVLHLGPLYDEIACALYNTTPENLSWQQRYKARSELYRRASTSLNSVSWQSRQALQSISR